MSVFFLEFVTIRGVAFSQVTFSWFPRVSLEFAELCVAFCRAFFSVMLAKGELGNVNYKVESQVISCIAFTCGIAFLF